MTYKGKLTVHRALFKIPQRSYCEFRPMKESPSGNVESQLVRDTYWARNNVNDRSVKTKGEDSTKAKCYYGRSSRCIWNVSLGPICVRNGHKGVPCGPNLVFRLCCVSLHVMWKNGRSLSSEDMFVTVVISYKSFNVQFCLELEAAL